MGSHEKLFNKSKNMTIDRFSENDEFLAYVRKRAERSWYADKELTPLETNIIQNDNFIPEGIRKVVEINETIDFDISVAGAMEKMRSAESPGCRAIDILEVVYDKISRMKREPRGAIERCFYEAAARRSELYNSYYG